MMEILSSILYSAIGFAAGWVAGRQARNIEQIHDAIVPGAGANRSPLTELGLVTVVILLVIITQVAIFVLGKA